MSVIIALLALQQSYDYYSSRAAILEGMGEIRRCTAQQNERKYKPYVLILGYRLRDNDMQGRHKTLEWYNIHS